MVDIGKNMKLLMIEDNTSVSEMMGMFYKKKHGMLQMLMMVRKGSSYLMRMSILGRGYPGFKPSLKLMGCK